MEALRMLSKSAGGGDYEAEVERLLSCPICLEVYSKPVVILPCQHNLCRKCANDVFQNRGTPMGSGGRFRCPTCRYEVMLDRHGVYGLQRNLLVENIIDMYQSESKKPFRKVEVLMCEVHEEEKVNIFCVTCQKPTCSLCKVFGQHQECTVAPLDKVQKDHKTEISGAIAMLVAGNDRLQTIISKIEELSTKTEENSNSVQLHINESFDKLYSVLEDRKRVMVNQIKTVTREKTEVLQDMLKMYGTKLESSSKLVEEALSLLEEPSAPQFLSISRELINRVTSSARATDVSKPSDDIPNMDIFGVDFSEHVEYLQQLNFPNAGPVFEDEYGELADRDAERQRKSSSNSVGDVFHAKLLLPKGDVAEEVVAAARVTRKDEEDEYDDDDTTSQVSSGRRESSTSDTKGLEQLDAEVKAIAERYLSGRASRQRSQASTRSASPSSTASRRKSYSEEKKKEKETSNDGAFPVPSFRSTLSNSSDETVTGATPTSRLNARTRFRVGGTDFSSQSPDRITQTLARSNSPPGTVEDPLPMEAQMDTLQVPYGDSSMPAVDRNRRSSRRLPRTYATHRRRTWSHLLDKK